MSDELWQAAHELNNRLTAVVTTAELYAKRSGEPAAAPFRQIGEAAHQAADAAAIITTLAQDRRYLRDTTVRTDALLAEVAQLCSRDGIPAVEPDTGRLLSVLVSCMLAGSILELGTAYGYSTLWMARAQPETGRIWTIDPDRRRTAIAREYFAKAGVSDRIEIIEQPALDVLPKLAQRQYDIVFIDALKEEYERYLELALPHLKRSGLVVVDNLLWHHRAAAAPAENDEESTKAIRRFNRTFLSHPQLNATILAVGDGVGIGAKIQ